MWVCGWVLAVVCLGASAQTMKPVKTTVPKTAYYLDPAVLNLAALLPDPPAIDSAASKGDLAELHRIEKTRSAAQVAAAKADEDNESLFLYKTVLGAGFTPEALPVTAELGAHVENEQSVAGGALKQVFSRPRPYQTDKTLHPVCALTEAANSYPAGMR